MKTTHHLFIALLVAGLLTLYAMPSCAQQNKNKHDLTSRTWSDGDVAYKAHRAAGGLIVFEGGTLHEGGYTFALKPEGAGFYRLQAAPGTDEVQASLVAQAGDVVGLRTFDGEPYLVFYGDKRTPVYVLAPITNLRQTVENNMVNYFLAGGYETRDGRQLIFFPTPPGQPDQTAKAIGLTDDGRPFTYTFGEEYDMPTNVICLPDGTNYLVERTDDGLTFRATTRDENDFWSQDGEVVIRDARHIDYVAWLKDLPGDFPLTATEPVTAGLLSLCSDRALRDMRNEIYARRGLRFHSPQVARHFEAQSWYKAEVDDVTPRLTELDQLNIEMIRREEARRKAQ